ncbi:MAG: HEPN domain-containing protein [bacterium]|jgi:HEPN domain-containing protein
MNEETIKNWSIKAERDLKIAQKELLTDDPITDAIFFHTQQAIEKYLKAFLIYNNKEIKKTHNIDFLINECQKIDQSFNFLFDINADKLIDYGTELIYPEFFYIPLETQEAVNIATKVK